MKNEMGCNRTPAIMSAMLPKIQREYVRVWKIWKYSFFRSFLFSPCLLYVYNVQYVHNYGRTHYCSSSIIFKVLVQNHENTLFQFFASLLKNTYPWKVLANEKRGGLKVVTFSRFPFKLFTLRFQINQYRPHLVRGIELLSEPCFCHLKSIIVSKHRCAAWWIQISLLVLCRHSKYR